MSNSPTAEMLFAANGNMGSFFLLLLCVQYVDGSLEVESIVNTFHLWTINISEHCNEHNNWYEMKPQTLSTL